MNAILNLGKWLFAVPFLVFGVFHFLGAKDMAGMVPFGGEIMVYITGVALVAAAVSMFIGKYDKLATGLLYGSGGLLQGSSSTSINRG